MNILRRKNSKMSINFNYNYPQLAREAGFRLRQYKDGPLDWRLLGCCEIERLVRDQSIEDVDRVLVHLSEAPLGSALLETNILDNGIAKFFIVSQFAIQYLLFCRNFLDETVQELRESHAEAQVEVARLKKLLGEANNEILQLHKKMTQMEAIHEVIYPCHLCTKNFANNEALNIHIGRKHPPTGGQNRGTNEKKLDTATSSDMPKERAKDLTLINTIKLELEIKQLKERLNNAEKEIKERHHSAGNSKQSSPRELVITPTTRNVAIQSNLSEEKEKNDCKDEDIVEHGGIERTAELEKLQEKIYDIEEWRATQMANNEDSIAEINRKLTNIAQVLERTTGDDVIDTLPIKPLERRLSVEDLERVLSEKVAEIGKANSEKLEEIVHNMELNYRDKLYELEREMQKAIVEKEQQEIKPTRVKRSTNEAAPVEVKTKIVETKQDSSSSEDEGTYNIEIGEKEMAVNIEKPPQSEANTHTIIKTVESKPIVVEKENIGDNTDISESLSEDEVELEKAVAKTTKMNAGSIQKQAETGESKPVEKQSTIKSLKSKSPRKYTRKDAEKLANKRLITYGFDMKAKSISSSSLKRINNNLNEKRTKLKQEYPDFYATRNKIKKFIDKLCTTKSSKKAEKLLNFTPTLQPLKAPKLETELEAHSTTTEDNGSDNDNNIQATKLESTNTKDDFKKRLERLLASPVRRPLSTSMDLEKKSNITVAAQIHTEQRGAVVPQPMPRKRVMFNTKATDDIAG